MVLEMLGAGLGAKTAPFCKNLGPFLRWVHSFCGEFPTEGVH